MRADGRYAYRNYLENHSSIDEWTLRIESLILQIAEAAETAGRFYFIGGGFAIDLMYGRLTRSHEDIDFHPMEDDTAWWEHWFVNLGYVVSREPDLEKYPNAFIVRDKQSRYVADVYPVAIRENSEVSMLTKDGDQHVWRGKTWHEVRHITYRGQSIIVENFQSVLYEKEQHARSHGGFLEQKHMHDFRLFNQKPTLGSKIFD